MSEEFVEVMENCNGFLTMRPDGNDNACAGLKLEDLEKKYTKKDEL